MHTVSGMNGRASVYEGEGGMTEKVRLRLVHRQHHTT
jgi:hypothetical protein